MGKQQKAWIARPVKSSHPSMLDSIKMELETKATDLIQNVLKPKHVLPPPEDMQFNYLIDIGMKWYRNYFYFTSTYACPDANALSPTFELRFARMEHIGDGKFNLAFMRHTDEWFVLYDGLSVDECLSTIRDDAWFMP
ncbi:MAG: hypothetical protein JWN70_3230 [Planctomycetaceae bacterium]|nr:hypothetical protein [Planctomycetaceae bacterium]